MLSYFWNADLINTNSPFAAVEQYTELEDKLNNSDSRSEAEMKQIRSEAKTCQDNAHHCALSMKPAPNHRRVRARLHARLRGAPAAPGLRVRVEAACEARDHARAPLRKRGRRGI